MFADTSDTNASPLLDSLFDTANSAVDVWAKWQDKKTETVIAKAAIPTTAANPAAGAGFAVDQKTLFIAAGVVAVGALVIYLSRR